VEQSSAPVLTVYCSARTVRDRHSLQEIPRGVHRPAGSSAILWSNDPAPLHGRIPDHHDRLLTGGVRFRSRKGIVLYSSKRTSELLRTAFGDEFIRTGKMPELGPKGKDHPAGARQTISAASYEKVAVSDLKKAPEPVKVPEPVQAQDNTGAGPGKAPGPEQAPLKETASEELPEDVQEVQSIESRGLRGRSSEHTTIIVCLECNKQLKVPIDQGVIT